MGVFKGEKGGWPGILAAISAVVVTLSGAVGFLFRQNSKVLTGQIRDKDKRISSLEAAEKADKEQIKLLIVRVTALEKENAELKSRFLLFQSSHDANPFPAWFKDRDGTMLACNTAYETVFLKPRGYRLEDYLGSKDLSVWPEHVAKAFEENDRKVLETGEIFDMTEMVVNKKNNAVPVRIVKYPRRLQGVSDPVGVAGIAIVNDLKGSGFNET